MKTSAKIRLVAAYIAVVVMGCAGTSVTVKAFAEERKKGAVWEPVGIGGGGGQFNAAVSPHDDKLLFVSCDMHGFYRSENGGKSWKMFDVRKIRVNYRSHTVFHPKDPDIVLTGGGGGLMISRDRGKTWAPFMDNPPWEKEYVQSVYYVWDKPNIMFVNARKGRRGEAKTRFSADGGKTWTLCTGVEGKAFSYYVTGDTFFIGTVTGVYRQKNNSRWEKKNPVPEGKFTGFCGGASPRGPVIYCLVDNKVFRSFDLGEKWEPAMGKGFIQGQKYCNHPSSAHSAIQSAETHGNIIFLNNRSASTETYKSVDYGNTWEVCYKPAVDNPDHKLSWIDHESNPGWSGAWYRDFRVHRRNPNIVLGCNSALTVMTTDGGKTWEQLNTDPLDGYKKGGRWKSRGLNVMGPFHYYVHPRDKEKHYMCLNDVALLMSEDSGKSWRRSVNGSPWTNTFYELAFDEQKPEVLYAAASRLHDIGGWGTVDVDLKKYCKGGILKSSDYGKTWKPVCNGLPEKPAVSIIKDKNILYAALFDAGVYRSDDEGETWVKKSNGLGMPGNMHVMSLKKHRDGTLFCLITGARKGSKFLVPGGLYKSTDKGENWTLVRAHYWSKGFGVHPDNSKIIFLGAAAIPHGKEPDGIGNLYRTTDGGKSWETCKLNVVIYPGMRSYKHCGKVFFEPTNLDHVFVNTFTHGTYESLDCGKTWREFKEDNPPFNMTLDIAWYNNYVYFSTFGAGCWRKKVK